MLNFLLAGDGVSGKLQLHWELKVVIDLMAGHCLEVPIEALERDDQEWRQLVEVGLAGCPDLLVQHFGVVHIVALKDVLFGEGRECLC